MSRRLAIPAAITDRLPLIVSLFNASDATRASVLDALDEASVRALVECALNVILGELPCSARHLRRLRRRRADLLQLTAARTSRKKRLALLATPLFRQIFSVAIPHLEREADFNIGSDDVSDSDER